MSQVCDREGHRMDYIAGRCQGCGRTEDEIIRRNARLALRSEREPRKPDARQRRIKGIVG